MSDSIREYIGREISPADNNCFTAVNRAALRELINLKSEAIGPILDELFDVRTGAETVAKNSYQKATESIIANYDRHKKDAEARHQQQLAELASQYDSKIAKLEDQLKDQQYEIRNRASAAMRELKAGNEYEQLSIETSCQATVSRCNQDRKETEQAMPQAREHIGQQQEKADWLMLRYRIGINDVKPAEVNVKEILEPDTVFVHALEHAKKNLHKLENITICRWFIGILPLLNVTVVSLLALALSWFISKAELEGMPAFGVLGTTATLGTFLAGSLASILIWRKGRNRALPVYEQICKDLALAGAALELRYEKATVELQAKKEKAKETAAKQLQALIEKHNAAIKDIQLQAERQLKELDAKSGVELANLKEERHIQLEQIEQDFTAGMTAIEQDYAKASASALAEFQAQQQKYNEQYDNDLELIKQQWRKSTAIVQSAVDMISDLPGSIRQDFSDSSWSAFRSCENLDKIRFGDLLIDTTITDQRALQAGSLELPASMKFPAVLSFPDKCSLLLHTRREGRQQAVDLLKATVLRLFTSLPAGRVHFTILDPVGLGENFAGFMHAADYEEALIGGRIWTSPAHIREQLESLTAHMENVIQKYLRNEFKTIEEYNRQAGELAEPYRFLVISDFPQNFTEESARYLKSIINSGARCGVYTLIAYDSRQELPDGIDLDDLRANAIYLKYQEENFVWQDSIFEQYPLVVDTPPSEELITAIMHKVGKAGQDSLRVEVPFIELIPKDDRLWHGDNGQELVIPIGRTGATRLQYLKLGRGMAQHVLIAGKTGSGKSTLLHVIISAMAACYSPSQVELYLIDFKKGVEFKSYAENRLPHARVVAIESDREFGLSVLARLEQEMNRRGNDFRNAGVQDIAGYRLVTGNELPRAILIVDEFQVFFTEDDKISQDAALLLEQLVRQGRAFGIHVILGSQTLGGPASLARSTIGQMAVRIAMQCSEADSQLILDDDNTAARLLTRPGEAIYNDAGGMVVANSPFQTAWINDAVRDSVIRKVTGKARELELPETEMIVFEGNAPASLENNKLLAGLISGETQPESLSPVAWVGEPVSIKDPTAVVFRRQSGANLLITGQREDSALHIIQAALRSLAVQVPDARFMIYDGSPAGSATQGQLAQMAQSLSLDHIDVPVRSVAEALEAVREELKERTIHNATTATAVFNIFYGLHRYRELRKGEDDFSFSAESGPAKPDKIFTELLREGPTFGIHTLVWCDTLNSLERALDRSTMREFDQRIIFQMSAADSSNLIDSTAANTLGFHRALYYSDEQGILEKFRPYK
ncbi:MAG: hypothetical protein JW745_05565 [Sedimentisphaerales bacterium]|nr:hypothetical protein [Sedimentisphaerales bacterium]MBN2842589.1 hypothetical protein [Sedimentisphaerales bacterium]